MADFSEAFYTDLLRPFIPEPDLREIAQKLHSDRILFSLLLAMTETQLGEFVQELWPAAPMTVRWGLKVATSQNRNSSEGESPSKKGKPAYAMRRYFERLLQPPDELPDGDAKLREFLSLVPVKLPLLSNKTFEKVYADELVTTEHSEGAEALAYVLEAMFQMFDNHRGSHMNEADSSAQLLQATGEFLRYLNGYAPIARRLDGLEGHLDCSNPTTSKGSSEPFLPLRRPDYQLYVKDCLMLRWENKSNPEDMVDAMKDNVSKLKNWSPLYYGKLPYVIGGACAGRKFRWLRLFSSGESIDYGVISRLYDLTILSDVAALLQSTVRMHCLLQKLQEKLEHDTKLRLYHPQKRGDDSSITFYPEYVMKVVELSDERDSQLRLLYEAIHGSLYIIQRKKMTTTRSKTTILLYPVGDPEATPVDLKELADATHDILHGLCDLHGAGFTHRDIRWKNIVRVTIKGKWKYVIIDLEEGGPDKEEWKSNKLKDWDEGTLDSEKRYTTGSDLYQFGKLLLQWLIERQGGSQEERRKVKGWGDEMKSKLTTTAKMLECICKNGCERCRTFDKAGNLPPSSRSVSNPLLYETAEFDL